MGRHRGRRNVTVAVLVFAFLASAAVVRATNFGSIIYTTNPESGAWLANNRTHEVDLHNTTTEWGAAIQWAMTNALDPTVMNTVLVDGSVYDVRVVDDNYNNFLTAWTSCPPEAQVSGSHPYKVCRGQKIHVNLQNVSGYTVTQRRSLACHELGHTVALRHVDNPDAASCMRVNVINRPTTYSGHDQNMISSNY